MPQPLNRRTFLRGAGVAVALPMLEATAATARARAASESQPRVKRFVCLSNNYGVYRKAFFPDPTDAGTDYQLPETLQPLARHRRELTLFTHLDHGNTGGHQGVPVLLSGVLPSVAAAYPEGNLSVDQKIAEFTGTETRFASLTLQVNEANLISFTRTGVQLPATDLRATFRKLFVDEDSRQKASAKERLQRQRSILDVVNEEARAMQRRLGRRDQRKFSEYLEAVRSLERKIAQAEPWLDRSKPVTELPEPPHGRGTEADLRAMMELIALAIETDSTRAITLSSGFRSGDFGLAGGYHGFSHHGEREREVAALKRIERNQIAQMAYLIELLKAKEDSLNGDSLLDHTTILFGCGMATGTHSNKSLPLVLAGGGFRHGEHLVYPEDPNQRIPAANLLLSILRNHGLEIERFGTSTGTLPGLRGSWS